jgi:MFS transporter
MRTTVSVDKRKIGLLAVLYASQGLAPGFAFVAVPALLRGQGVSLMGVGLSTLLLLPMAFKFVLGPWADGVAAAGRERSWMTGLQSGAALCFFGLSMVPPERGAAPFLAVIGVAYLLIAIVDVITDGVAVRLLAAEERPLGNAAQYGGYYAGAIFSGGLFLAILPRLGWAPAVSLLALLILAGLAAARVLPALPAVAPATGGGAPRASTLAFLLGPLAWQVLLLLFLLDLPQNVGIAMAVPFLVDGGLTLPQVGLVYGIGGMLAAAAGAFLGGALLSRVPRVTALVIAGVLQSLSLLGLAALATQPKLSLAAAFAVVGTASGLASVFNITLSSWFMDNSSPNQPATDYSVMACAHVATYAFIGGLAGKGAATVGFPVFFATTGALALGLVLVAWPWLRRLARPAYTPVVPAAIIATE